MKQIHIIICGVLSIALTVSAQMDTMNYCYNGSFIAETGHLDGWNLDYDWTGLSIQQGNHLNASYLPEFKGKKNVMRMKVPHGYESKIECKLIPYHKGERYKCTFDIYIDMETIGSYETRALFNGYRFKPGIRPYDDPKLQDLRRIFKTNLVPMKSIARWRRMTIDFPTKPKVSKTAYAHLKKIRYLSLFIFVPGGTYPKDGNFYLANVNITKLPREVTVKK
ncbi:MAG: hypothetical protein PF904_05920 [Kiritimatiellae bacterium]|jgi:hypothetical protein|nr:hypothetical protein [Kiritimatiellia bacterium]